MSDSSRREISDEKIAGLLRLTGPRPPVPEDLTRRVKSVVRARWRIEARRRPQRRVWALAALAAAAALVAIVGVEWRSRRAVPPAQDPMSRIEAVVGQASTRAMTDGPPRGILAGYEVPAGSLLETGENGRLALRLPSATSLRLDVGTRVAILSDSAVTLMAGAIYVDSGGPGDPARPDDASIDILTPAGRVRDIGTQFEVRLLDVAVRLRVREGLVTLERPSGKLEIGSGRELRVDGDGGTSSRDLPIHGAEWAWIEPIAPLMEIEGRSLREFLDWMARERGFRIRFSGGDLEVDAGSIRLNGSIQGMTLDQALESVLLASRMRHRIEADLLVVERLEGPPGSS